MKMRHLRTRLTKAAVVTVALGAVAGSVVTGFAPAGADPKFVDAFVTTGSDTTEDVMGALAGYQNGRAFTPVESSAETGRKMIVSWDSKGTGADNCIAPKLKAPTIYRSNGSSEGRRSLSRAIDGTGYGPVDQCGGTKDVSGLIDFARSSAGPTGGDTGTALTYIPLGRDALSFAYYANGVGSPVTSLTKAQLTSLFTSGPATINGVEIVPCGIQLGSGTYQSWNTTVGVNQTTETAATATCRDATTTSTGDGRVQENDAAGLKAKGDALVGKQVIIGFSASNFISQSNGFAKSQLAAGVNLGGISDDGNGNDLGVPISGTAPNVVPRAEFYDNATFGRTVYNVFPTSKVTGLGNNDLKSLFVGPTSAVCSEAAQTIVNQFGFSTVADCGSTSLKGSLFSGIK